MDASEEFIIVCVTAPLLLHKLQNLLNYGSKAPVRTAIYHLQLISTWLRDTEKIPTNLDVKDVLWRQFLSELHDLEDVIDNLIGEIELQLRNDSLKIMSPLICLRPQQDGIGQDGIGRISGKLDNIITSANRFRELENLEPTTGTTSSPLQPRNLHYPVPDDSDIVGLNYKVKEFEFVVLRPSGEMPNTIAVTGARGSGKTFLTKTVYNATEVKRQFDGRAWVNFSEDFKTREFLIDILTQLTWDWESLDENLSYDELQLKLQNFSSEKRCLIVVDNVGTRENIFIELFTVCGLTSNKNCLVLIVSVEDKELAFLDEVKHCFSNIIRLESLTDEDSWTLFCKKAPRAEQTTRFKENILTNCGGSPRKILLMGGLLSTTKRSVIELIIQNNFLISCYRDLSSRMKVCFLYLRLFPRAFEIPVRRLFHLWVAEGLCITPHEENKAPEDLAEKFLELLIRRNLIEVAKVRLDGSPKTCRMPTFIWDVLSPTAAAFGHHHDHNQICGYGGRGDRQFKIPNWDRYDGQNSMIDPQVSLNIRQIRSYVSFNTESSGKFLDALVNLRGFGLLVVLDLENVYKPALLSETLGKLLHLKHLGLRRTFLDSLPRSVGNLPYLQTLDVKHTNMTTLPSSIWKAKKLQHLYLNENNFDMSFKKTYTGSDSEIILQTLSGLFIGNKNVVKSYLYSLRHLRKLKLTFYSKSVEGIASWISELKALRSLKLRSIDEFDRPATLELGSLETHHELLELYLVGPLKISIESLCSPNLRVLTLSASKLGEDPMPILGKLRHLNCLRLFRNSYLGKEMICLAEEFPQLRVLKLWMLENLEEWNLMEGTMPLLRELEIRLCPKLHPPEKLPLTLKDVVLINMPDRFVKCVERVQVNSFVKKIELPFAALPE